jgi:hypothetical protein
VTLGLGSVVASVVSSAPWLAALSSHKTELFAVSGALLAFNYWLVVFRPRRCAPGELCHPDTPAMRVNRRVLYVSIAVYVVAAAVTFGAALTMPSVE